MTDRVENQSPEAEKAKLDSAELFIKFYYPEIKDLTKSFLTLVSGILAFSVTFSNTTTETSSFPKVQLMLLVFSWLFFILAIILSGYGLYINFVKANVANTAIMKTQKVKFKTLISRSYAFIRFAGFAFVIALFFLVCSAAFKLL